MNKIKIGVLIPFGEYDWRVLDVREDMALLLSEKVLEQRAYNTESEAITWEQCTLRKYLNNEFYNKLGTAKAAIATTSNQNPNNQWYGTSGGNATQDKVFLLSLEEVDYYFGNSGDSGDYANKRRKNYEGKNDSTGYCFHNSHNESRIAKNGKGEACWWWLRSPGVSSDSAASVYGVGSVFVLG
jgi:hypothetical protein